MAASPQEPPADPARPPMPDYTFVEPPPTPALAYLQGFKQWVCWFYKWKEGTPAKDGKPATPGKWDKPALRRNGNFASTNDPNSWASYPNALQGREKHNLAGIGFVLAIPRDPKNPDRPTRNPIERRKGDRLTGIDLDKCRDPATGTMNLPAFSVPKCDDANVGRQSISSENTETRTTTQFPPPAGYANASASRPSH
jgi:hypothetical protein